MRSVGGGAEAAVEMGAVERAATQRAAAERAAAEEQRSAGRRGEACLEFIEQPVRLHELLDLSGCEVIPA